MELSLVEYGISKKKYQLFSDIVKNAPFEIIVCI